MTSSQAHTIARAPGCRPVAKLDGADILDIAAYVASLPPAGDEISRR